jgi:hypothetical protein
MIFQTSSYLSIHCVIINIISVSNHQFVHWVDAIVNVTMITHENLAQFYHNLIVTVNYHIGYHPFHHPPCPFEVTVIDSLLPS